MSDSQPSAADGSLSPLHLADALLENVTKCPHCAKPVIQSAMADHQANCQAIREGRIPDSANLKRRLSEASNASSVPPKKSKLVLHLGGPAATPNEAKPKPSEAPKKNKRIVDVDRQCGVINDKGYPCPRSLTCKTHNMSAKRAVPHRSQPYDLLLFEWQKANKANQQKAEAAKLAQPGGGAGNGSGAAGATGAGGVGGGAGGGSGTARTAAAAAAAAAATAVPGETSSLSVAGGPAAAAARDGAAGPPSYLSGTDASASALAMGEPQKAKRRRNGNPDGALGAGGLGGSGFRLPGDKKGKKGIVYVGEWEESDDDGADELVDSDEEVEAVLRGLARAERGRPLFISRGGGAGFAAASMFTGRNHKLATLRGTLRDVFRPAA